MVWTQNWFRTGVHTKYKRMTRETASCSGVAPVCVRADFKSGCDFSNCCKIYCNGDGAMWLAASVSWEGAECEHLHHFFRLGFVDRHHAVTRLQNEHTLHCIPSFFSDRVHVIATRGAEHCAHGTMRTRDACIQIHGVTFERFIMHAMCNAVSFSLLAWLISALLSKDGSKVCKSWLNFDV